MKTGTIFWVMGLALVTMSNIAVGQETVLPPLVVNDNLHGDPSTPGNDSPGDRIILYGGDGGSWKNAIGFGSANDIWFQAHGSGPGFRFFTGGGGPAATPIEKMRINMDGNVGIGTTAPGKKLEVNGDVKLTGGENTFIAGYATGGDDYVGQFKWHRLLLGNNGTNEIRAGKTARGGRLKFIVDNTADINSPHDGVEVMLLSNSGLTVSGAITAYNSTVTAKEVVVTADWPDFVFHDDYPLMPLRDVEHHITQHSHLPGIPSAKEVLEEGVSLGDMQAKLLQKVEELTLYMIEQSKKLTKLEAENVMLKERFASFN